MKGFPAIGTCGWWEKAPASESGAQAAAPSPAETVSRPSGENGAAAGPSTTGTHYFQQVKSRDLAAKLRPLIEGSR